MSINIHIHVDIDVDKHTNTDIQVSELGKRGEHGDGQRLQPHALHRPAPR
jgi:hypothetical protein